MVVVFVVLVPFVILVVLMGFLLVWLIYPGIIFLLVCLIAVGLVVFIASSGVIVLLAFILLVLLVLFIFVVFTTVLFYRSDATTGELLEVVQKNAMGKSILLYSLSCVWVPQLHQPQSDYPTHLANFTTKNQASRQIFL